MRLKLFLFSIAALTLGSAAHAQDDNGVTDASAAPEIRYASGATPAADPENTLLLDLSTGGRVTIRLREDAAPNHVERIKTLARRGFYNGIIFHRVIEGFMAQTGDPTGTGQGGSDLPNIDAEFTTLPHVRGVVSMARATEPNSANSQFYIMFMPNLGLDRNYTAFGRVVAGMEYVDIIPRGEPPANPARIIRASIAADNVLPPTAAEIAALTQPATNDQAAALDAALGAESAGETPQ
jgi:cyclophilin family peptidyl-prolyl cis-trans isomerase